MPFLYHLYQILSFTWKWLPKKNYLYSNSMIITWPETWHAKIKSKSSWKKNNGIYMRFARRYSPPRSAWHLSWIDRYIYCGEFFKPLMWLPSHQLKRFSKSHDSDRSPRERFSWNYPIIVICFNSSKRQIKITCALQLCFACINCRYSIMI